MTAENETAGSILEQLAATCEHVVLTFDGSLWELRLGTAGQIILRDNDVDALLLRALPLADADA